MSEVSFIRAAPPQSAPAQRRTADAPDSASRENNARRERASALTALPNKTTVKAEQIAKYQFGYTFIDAETSRVIGRYPAEPFVTSNRKIDKVV